MRIFNKCFIIILLSVIFILPVASYGVDNSRFYGTYNVSVKIGKFERIFNIVIDNDTSKMNDAYYFYLPLTEDFIQYDNTSVAKAIKTKGRKLYYSEVNYGEIIPKLSLNFKFYSNYQSGKVKGKSSQGKIKGNFKKVTTITTINDFVGTWKGSITFKAAGEYATCSDSTIILDLNSGQLDGILSATNCGGGSFGTNDIFGNVINGIFFFDMPNSEPYDPDCANWNLPMTASLDTKLTSMIVKSSGIVCGPGGGKQGTVTGLLTKQ